jgi:tetratricopeptide (TPR) repeat protein
MACSTANSLRACIVLGALAWLSPARADDERDPQVAQSLFNRARALMDEGQFAEACPMLKESQRLDPGGGTLLNYAVCLEGEGKLASALEQFQEARSLALRDKRDDRQRIAEERIASIEPRLSKLTVSVSDESRVNGLRVTLDGRKLSKVAWGVPISIDGGAHRVEANAPGHEPWKVSVLVENEGDAPVVLIELVAKEEAKPIQGRKRKKKVSSAGWALVGSGLGLFAASVGMGVGAIVIDDNAEEDALAAGCNLSRHYCPNALLAADFSGRAETAQALGWAATIGLIGSAPLIIAGPFLRDALPIKPMVTPVKSGALVGVELSF